MSRVFGISAVLLSLAAPSAQDAAPSPEATLQKPILRTGTTGVVLDVVVRDRRGRAVRDIEPSEFTISEDGVPREVRSFRLVERAAQPSRQQTPAAASDQPDALRYPALVTLVFDNLTQNGRTLARGAAQLLAREMPDNQWMAVYALDQRLRLAQPFTKDADALRHAIEQATTSGPVARDYFSTGAGNQDDLARAAEGAVRAAAAERAGVDTAATAAAVSAAIVREVIARMERMVETADLQYRGQSTLFPLMALIKAQGTLAGRKALVIFSEGFAIPPNLEEAYRSAISEANRANVSVYAVDARGLDTARALDQSRQMLDRSARNSQAQLVAGRSQRPVTLEDVMNPETAETALRSDTQTALRALAEETGGALIANTNDLGPALAGRVRDDLDSYYEIGYVPASTIPDGRFRPVEVKIARRGLTIHSRSGYFALPETDATPLLPYELPMLAAAAAEPSPRAFDYAGAVYRFDRSSAGVRHTIVLEIPLEHLTFAEDRRRRTYALRFTAMALVKDPAGQIVQRLSESYPLEGPLDRLPALRRGRLRFMRHIWLAPGRYTLWMVARDQATERSSVRALPLDVPDVGGDIQISDLSLIRAVEHAGAAADPFEDPFRTGGMRVVPNLGLPISKSANREISAYVTIYPGAKAEAPGLLFEFSRDGQVIGRSAAALPAPDEAARIKYVASFPTDRFEPGTYGLRAVATQGGTSAISHTQFTLIP